jgi:two-component system, NarL family, nitrate/nitrite response regulator NarL
MDHKIITVLVAPKTLLREGLASLLASTHYKPAMSVSCVEELARGRTPAADKALFVVSRDALTRGGQDVMADELHLLKDYHPGSRVLVLSDTFNFADVVTALRAGANGYVMNTLSSEALVKSLDLVALGETVLASEFAQAVSDMRSKALEIAVPPPAPQPMTSLMTIDEADLPRQHYIEPALARQLSSRETAILSCLVNGDSNKHIARGMGVAEATVKTHIKAILRKIRVKNRTQAAMWAYTNLPRPMGVELHAVSLDGTSLPLAVVNGDS